MDAWFVTLSNLPEPTDADVDKSGEEARPLEQGRVAMQAIAETLKASSVTVTHPVDEWEAYGWVFTIREGSALINCMLQWGDGWLLMCWAHRTFGDRFRGRRFTEELEHARGRIGAAISTAFNVSEPSWRSEA